MTPLQNCAVASPSPGLGLRRPLLTENMTTTWICALRNGTQWAWDHQKNISLYTNSDLSYKRITLAHERGGRTSSRTRVRMRWTRAASARLRSRRAGQTVSEMHRADERRRRVRQNRVVLAVVATVKLSRRCIDPTGI